MKKLGFVLGVALLGAISGAAHAEVGMGLRVGTHGYGADLDIGIVEKLNLRIGYNLLNYSHTIDDTDVVYDGELDMKNASLLLDWHPFASGFRLSFGAVGPGLTVDVVGKPTGGTYQIGDSTYTAAQIGTLNGQLKSANSVAPYVGIGWGNAVDKNHRVTFLFDLGVAYIGKSDVSLSATCGPTLNAAQCNALQVQLQPDIAAEQQDMEESVAAVQWWPVIQIGLGIRF
jgi:hypothetical protein